MSINGGKIEAEINKALVVIQQAENLSLPLSKKLEDCDEQLKELKRLAYTMNAAILGTSIALTGAKKLIAEEFEDGI
ncbi:MULTISPECIES: hypothetical protein [Aerococcus]|uniref:Uncharacterized protein n=1 Tax=Aerococcus sanguinicola TaxID=119206 RepID=A0A5N1GNP0_9LACT|nr:MULTISPECIES: hypothetical protein [Aerococcus]KAA9301936.1 hypothetical protein F6I03_01645 [Aerococcus sanguinicola]MDK6368641.1 hypothetical protein [Aerococcus sp. UMB9870]MDK6679724.1 hypothetical protein [Aerococcus sp. UMB8608]MDK6686004.1 hypothetical protein [Aerococcus sp. UMB8623]MDK6940810.1 hypothetical protein [Aerococcus sp. UMB8487]